MRCIGSRPQRTLARPVEVRGVGFVTGKEIRVRFLPTSENAGVTFVRVDLNGRVVTPARADRVSGTARRTTLGGPNSGVTLVEHALAALAGLRIDNCRIEVGGPEMPGLDGSARGFVEALMTAGTVNQSARRSIYATTEPIIVAEGGATVGLHPPDRPSDCSLRATYALNYGEGSPIPPQTYTLTVLPSRFAREVAGCRTFLLEREAAELRKQGIGRHLAPADLLVFSPRGPIDNAVRYGDEPARHKVLDMLGDLALCGFDLAGHVVAYRSGHALNVALAAALVAGVNAVPLRRTA